VDGNETPPAVDTVRPFAGPTFTASLAIRAP
jgi:hypothetical protein